MRGGRLQGLQVGPQLAVVAGLEPLEEGLVRRERPPVAVHEPGRRRAGRAADRAPGQVAAVPRARQRHVAQAQRLRARLEPGLRARLLVAGIELQRRGVLRGGVVKEDRGRRRRPALRLIPEVRAEHDGELQALAAMDGDDLHQLLVALQAQLRFLAAIDLALPPLAQPVDELRDPEPAAGGLRLQQLDEMQQVGHAPRPVGHGQQPRRHALPLQQPAAHDEEPGLAPDLVVFIEAQHHRLPVLLLARERMQRPGVGAQQRGDQRRAHAGVVTRALDRAQHVGQLLRLLAVVDAVVGLLGAVDGARGQGLLDLPALRMLAHQHGDVAAAQGP